MGLADVLFKLVEFFDQFLEGCHGFLVLLVLFFIFARHIVLWRPEIRIVAHVFNLRHQFAVPTALFECHLPHRNFWWPGDRQDKLFFYASHPISSLASLCRLPVNRPKLLHTQKRASPHYPSATIELRAIAKALFVRIHVFAELEVRRLLVVRRQ